MFPFARRHRPLAISFVVMCIAMAMQARVLKSQSAPQGQTTVNVNGHDAVAGEVLVQFANIPSATRHQMLAQQSESDQNVPVGRGGLRRFHSRSFDVDTLLRFFDAQPDVVFAEPNYILRALATPNDPQFPNLWGLLNTGQFSGIPGADIHATAAWDISKGSTANVVGVIDTGIDYTHPDLAANIWSAPAAFTVTIRGVPIQCPAGSHGYNAIMMTCDPMDDNAHGTHVSGTIGAVGNNGIGVAGVNWTASIIGGKFLGASGSGSLSNAVDAIDFMIQTKAAFGSAANIRVLSNSWGGGGFSSALENAIADANGSNMLFVAAAGNAGQDIDSSPSYPASYSVANVVAVAATTDQDIKASFSNYGASSVHIAAPGQQVLSTVLGGGYQYFTGTSMATPHVSGAAALLLSKCSLSTANLKSKLLTTVDVLASLTGLVSTSGRLNVDRAIRSCSGGGTSKPLAPTGLTASAGDGQVNLTWSASADATSYKVKRSLTSGGPYTTIASGVAATSYQDGGLTNGVTYFYVVSAVNSAGESPNSAERSATPVAGGGGGIPAPPTGVTAVTGSIVGTVDLSWNASASATKYRVKRSRTSGGPYKGRQRVTTLNYTDTGISGRRYYYVITAINALGESGPSTEVTAVAR